MTGTDNTHNPELRSWVTSANGHPDFPIQNLPLGVFSPLAGAPRGAIAIGDMILDLRALHDANLLEGEAQEASHLCSGPTLNAFLALGATARHALRTAVSALLAQGAQERPDLLHRTADYMLYLPAQIGDYTDLYAGIHHATNVGKLFRPDDPLLPNYKWVPIGYHGRASSIRRSGTEVRRPNGQRKYPDHDEPSFGPTERLDYELELGIWVGPGNALGTPIPINQAASHIAGYCLLNDWSARDFQAWEYRPLGPFLSKNFHSTISPWIVTPEALAPFRAAQPKRPQGDPQPLPYLWGEADQQAGALDLELEALLLTPAMRNQGMAPHRLSRGNASNLYWTPAQLLTHHASNGCNLQSGDLLGSGTISSAIPDGYGSLLEITRGGREKVRLPSGETRGFLEDGDEVILRARTHREGYVSIGFGECRATIVPPVTN
ncbi:MAG: fumarylacetoacetase [Acetobacteraceae bacterium]|nr:fumarylacetoacetase [Acetobacteraceae bacterium]